MLILMLSFCGNLSITVVIGCLKWLYGDPTIDHIDVNARSLLISWIFTMYSSTMFFYSKERCTYQYRHENFLWNCSMPRVLLKLFYWGLLFKRRLSFWGQSSESNLLYHPGTCSLGSWGQHVALSLPCGALPLDIDSRHGWFLKQSTILVCVVLVDNFRKKWPKIHNESRRQTSWRDDTSLHQH